MLNRKKVALVCGGLTSLMALLTVAPPASARTPERVAPASMPSAKQTASPLVVPVLKGLVFVAHVQDVAKAGVSIQGVNRDAVPFLQADFGKQISAYLGHRLTLSDLNEITHSVVAYYRAHNRPLVDVVTPAQDVQSGTVQIAVTEFKVGQVRSEGNRWFSDSIVTRPVTLKHGDAIDSALLINQLDEANTNPFRRVNLVYRPGAEPGYTDLVLKTEDRLPVRVFSGFDNSGTAATGRNRWEMGVTWGNALWHDEQLSYQFSSSPSFFTGNGSNHSSFQGHNLTWSIPVRGRDSITISGNYDRGIPNVGTDFGMVGQSGGASVRYNLALRRTGSLIHTLSLGYEFKTTNNNLQFGGTNVSRTNTEIDQMPLTYAANLFDKWGSSQLISTVTFSPGHITPNNNATAFRPADGQSGRDFASARYLYWRSDATRLTKLPDGAVWAMRVLGQTSTSNLLYTEQLAAGGQEILRGYDPYAILGDSGVVLSNELRSPAFYKRSGDRAQWLGNVQVLGFWDWGHLNAAHPVANSINHVNASSAGFGLRYGLRGNVSARMDYGWQLQHLPGTGNRDHLLSFGIITSY